MFLIHARFLGVGIQKTSDFTRVFMHLRICDI
jgi:hypothetical protein